MNGELRPSAGRLTRGLSALFWGLPLALVLSVQTVTLSPLGLFGWMGFWAPSAAFGLLLYGLLPLGRHEAANRAWRAALDRARLLALVNLGLSPFLSWYQRLPETEFFATGSTLLAGSVLAFLLALNGVLRRLAGMLPDRLLQHETLVFTRLNAACLLLLPVLTGLWVMAWRWPDAPLAVHLILQHLEPFRLLLLLFLTLLPFSITMSLLWRIKTTLLELALAEGRSPSAPTPPP